MSQVVRRGRPSTTTNNNEVNEVNEVGQTKKTDAAANSGPCRNITEILVAPITLATSEELDNTIYGEGAYYWHTRRQPGMPTSVNRPTPIVKNLGSDKAPLTQQQLAAVMDCIGARTEQIERSGGLIEDDSIVKFFKETLGQSPRMSYLQPGSEIMSACKIKAEFWLLHMDVPAREKLRDIVKICCKNASASFPGARTVGITVPFRFKRQAGVDAAYENTIGLMNIETAKMRWQKNASDIEKSNTVVEISICQTEKPVFDGPDCDKCASPDTDEEMRMQFVTDMGQFVKPSLSYVSRMTKEDVEFMLAQHGFRSHLLSIMQMDGKQLMRLIGQSQDTEKLGRILSMPPKEIQRLLSTMMMISRRATPVKYNERLAKCKDAKKAGKIFKKMRNTAEIEFLPFYKPVQVRCNSAITLEAEIRSTAELVVNKILDDNEIKNFTIERSLATGGCNHAWRQLQTKEMSQSV